MAKQILLFHAQSRSNESPVFEIKKQVTVVAHGMMPGDFITFEVIKVASGARSSVCGCFLSEAEPSSITGVEPINCPDTCPGDEPQPVRLTAESPIVILNYPQDSLLRAIYHGEGVDAGTVNAYAQETDTRDLTAELRGCPCCSDNWVPTGVERCGDEFEEVQEVNDCGDLRWVQGDAIEWVATGNTRCAGDNVEEQQVSPCGDLRWVVTGPVAWTDTGAARCAGDTVEIEQRNQCGDTRWVEAGAVEWVATGVTRCVGDDVEAQETNQCGDLRWVVTGEAEWVGTGCQRCTATTVQLQETNQCGHLRWVDSEPVEWVASGAELCIDCLIVRQEVNQCGRLRWIETDQPCVHDCAAEAPFEMNVTCQATGSPGSNCWTFTVDRPVEDEPLVFNIDVVINGNSFPGFSTGHIAVGETSFDYCPNVNPGPDETIEACVTADTSHPLIASANECCTEVIGEPEQPYDITISCQQTASVDDTEICFTATTDRTVQNTNLQITLVRTIDGNPGGTRNLTIPVGMNSVMTCYPTPNVPEDQTWDVCVTADTSPPRIGSSTTCCTAVEGNPSVQPDWRINFLDGCGACTIATGGAGTVVFSLALDQAVTVETQIHGTIVAPDLPALHGQQRTFTIAAGFNNSGPTECLSGVTNPNEVRIPANPPPGQPNVLIQFRITAADNPHLWSNPTAPITVENQPFIQRGFHISVCENPPPPPPGCCDVDVECVDADDPWPQDGQACWTVTRAACDLAQELLLTGRVQRSLQFTDDLIPIFFPANEDTVQVCVPVHPGSGPENVLFISLFVLVEDNGDLVCETDWCGNSVAGGACTEGPFDVTVTCLGPDPVGNGDEVCFTVTLDRPTDCGVAIPTLWSGSNQALNNYVNQSLFFEPGESSGQICQTVTAGQEDTQLCLEANTSDPAVASSTQCCYTINAIPAAPEVLNTPSAFGCCATEDGCVTAQLVFRTDRAASAGHTCQIINPVTWLRSDLNSADYEIFVEDQGAINGTPTGTIQFNTWMPIDVNRTLFHTLCSDDLVNPPGAGVVRWVYQIRRASNQEVLGGGTVDIELAAGPGAACV